MNWPDNDSPAWPLARKVVELSAIMLGLMLITRQWDTETIVPVLYLLAGAGSESASRLLRKKEE